MRSRDQFSAKGFPEAEAARGILEIESMGTDLILARVGQKPGLLELTWHRSRPRDSVHDTGLEHGTMTWRHNPQVLS